MWRIACFLPLFMILMVLAGSRAYAETTDAGDAVLFLNSHAPAQLQGMDYPAMFTFTPVQSGDYSFRTFHAQKRNPSLNVWLYAPDSDRPIATYDGVGSADMTASLIENVKYTLIVNGRDESEFGEVFVQVMSDARGRSFNRPIDLTDAAGTYSKKITQPRDTHWYAYTASATGRYAVRSETEEPIPLDVEAYIVSGDGETLYYADDIFPPGDTNFSIYADFVENTTYYIRISAISNETGTYRLAIVPLMEGSSPTGIFIEPTAIVLPAGETAELAAIIKPEGAIQDMMWSSSDHRIATVSSSGIVQAVRGGTATILATADNGTRAQCTVTVPPVPIEGISYEAGALRLRASEGIFPALTISPHTADSAGIGYSSDDPTIATVEQNGAITGISPGKTTIRAATADSKHHAEIQITVETRLPVYRALLFSECNYADGRSRTGAAWTAEALYRALSYHEAGGGYQTEIKLDNTLNGMRQSIESMFAEAQAVDVSVLYFSGHGDVENGTAYLELSDGTHVTAQMMESLVKVIPGDVVLLLDFCYSGAFIGKSSLPDANRRGTPFIADTRTHVASVFAPGRYHVLTSSSFDQKSHRLGTGGADRQMATVFGGSICEAFGYNMARNARAAMRADLNGDRRITLYELHNFISGNVRSELAVANAAIKRENPSHAYAMQSPQCYPAGDTLELFYRPPR